jgi:hypothetical protein
MIRNLPLTVSCGSTIDGCEKSIDLPSCNSGVSPTKNPDIAGHGPSVMLDPTWFRLVSGGIS